MRIAMLGGTFDPVHYGHLRVAEEVREGMGFDSVLLVPASHAPHKTEGPEAPAAARLDMLKSATRGNPGLEVSDIEIKRGGKSFTVETVTELKGLYKDADLSLIVGVDSFNDITTWCDYERLFESASFIVAARAHHAAKKPAEALPVELAREFWYDADTESYKNSHGKSITYLATTMMDVSSTDIRRRVGAGSSIRYLVPACVEEYIKEHGLYTSDA